MKNSTLNFPAQFTLKVFNSVHHVSEEDRPYLESAYKTWKETWLDVYNNEMNQKNTTLYSNEFSRHSFILALFLNQTCIGVSFMREVNIKSELSLEDSYFRFWPKEVLQKLGEVYQNIIIASYFTISHEFRKNRDFEWKTLFLTLYKDFHNSLDKPLMITAARKLRSNEKLCYDLGGICFKKDIAYKSEDSQDSVELTDILYWKPNVHFTLFNPLLQEIREKVWRDFRREKNDELLSA